MSKSIEAISDMNALNLAKTLSMLGEHIKIITIYASGGIHWAWLEKSLEDKKQKKEIKGDIYGSSKRT